MSIPRINPAHPSLTSPTDQKASQIDANLRLATENAQPIRLRRLLQGLRHTQPDAHKVTGALLLATQQRYAEKIRASKGTQSDEDEDDKAEEDDDDESESDGSSDAGDIPELSSEEEEDDEDSSNDADNGMKRSELRSGEEDDGMHEAGASTATSTRHMPVKSELRQKD